MEQQTHMRTYGGFWIRLLAYIIDSVIISTGLVVINLIFFGTSSPESSENWPEILAAMAISIIASWLYFALLESSHWQATVGKRVLRLQVYTEDIQRVSFGRATARHFSKLLSGLILCIGFLMIAFTKKKQGLHDFIARTIVIREEPLPEQTASAQEGTEETR